MFARLLFYPTLGYNAAISKLSGRNWYDRVDETVIIGALPTKNISEKLIQEEGIKGVLSLNEKYELKYLTYTQKQWAEKGVEQLHLEAVDLTGTVSQEKLFQGVNFILSHRSEGNTVYVHCKAGKTRSATMVMCYLMQAYNFTPQRSHSILIRCRPHIWLRGKQWDSIYRFYNNLKQGQLQTEKKEQSP